MRFDLRQFCQRHWSFVASALLHAAVGAALLIVLPSLLEPVPRSDDSEQVIPVEVEQLRSQSAPQPAAQTAAETQPILQSPGAKTAPPSPRPPSPQKVTAAPRPQPMAPPVAEPASPAHEAQPVPTPALATASNESNDRGDQVASLPPGPAGPPPDYLTKIRLQLERNKVYPRIAQLRRQEGTVVLSFVIDRNGHVLKHVIEQSSGYSVLDQEAEAILNRSEPLPPIPPEMTGRTLEIVVPLQFALSDSSGP